MDFLKDLSELGEECRDGMRDVFVSIIYQVKSPGIANQP